MRNLSSVASTRTLLIAGALLGLTASACDWGPKKIGDETASGGDPVCEDGETKPSDDGCNTCTCEGGEWGCTLKGCEDPTATGGAPNDTEGPAACVDGEQMPAPDGCNTCTCEGGTWACTEIGCVDTEGPPDPSGAPNDTETGEPGDTDGPCVDGEEKPSPDGCNSCICYEGSWACTDAACPDTDGEALCGDGVVGAGEQCDDGNVADGDGCSTTCTLEGADGGAIQVCPWPVQSDELFYNSAVIVGDELHAEVEHGGGCEKHAYTYCWSGAFDLSEPVQVGTAIDHDSNGDQCEALLTQPLVFDLTPLKQEWQKLSQKQSGTIIVHIAGFAGSPLDYSF